MPLGDYLSGLVLFAFGVGVPTAAAWRVTAQRLRWMRVEARIVAWGLLTLGAVALTTGLPLVLGVLNRGTVVLAALVIGALSLLVRAGDGVPERPLEGPGSSTTAWVGAFAVATAAVIWLVTQQRLVAGSAIQDIDSTAFILPTLKTWIFTGSMWDARDFVPGWAFGAYPNTAGLVQLGVMVPWHAEFLLRTVNVVVIGLGAMATYALAVELGAARAWAVTCATLASVLPAAGVPGFAHAQTDSLAATGLVAGALFVCRHSRTGARSELWLAALALGLAFGTKWYAPPQVAVLLGVWGAALLVKRRWAALPRVVAVGAGAGAIGALWLVRNLAEFGSPLYPSKAGFFDGPARTAASSIDFSIAHYFDEPGVIREILLPQFAESFTLAGGVLLLGAVAAAFLAARAREARPLAVALAGGLILAVYTTMPYTALGAEGEPNLAGAAVRYAVPGFLIAAACSAWAISRAGPRVQLGAAVAALVALVHALTSYFDHSGGEIVVPAGELLLTAVGLVALAAVALAVRRTPWLRTLSLGILALAAIGVGRWAQEDQLSERFATDPSYRFIADRASEDRRIGVTGFLGGHAAFTAAAFGPRIDNDVRFVGPRIDELQQRDTAAGPFQRRLAAIEPDYLVVAAELAGPARELDWARAAGWKPVAQGRSHTVLAAPEASR